MSESSVDCANRPAICKRRLLKDQDHYTACCLTHTETGTAQNKRTLSVFACIMKSSRNTPGLPVHQGCQCIKAALHTTDRQSLLSCLFGQELFEILLILVAFLADVLVTLPRD